MINIKLLIFIIGITYCTQLKAQYCNYEISCSDSVLIKEHQRMKGTFINPDSLKQYYIQKCKMRSKFGVRLEIGISKYYYDQKTSNWIGNHFGPTFNLYFSYDKFNIGARFKPFTVNPNEELNFNNQILNKNAKLNPNKIDYVIGYSFNHQTNFTIEPTIGYSLAKFVVINQKEINQSFSFPNIGGLIIGITINKYFRIKEIEYIAFFISTNYCFIDYSIIHPNLGKNYFELNFGLALKGFFEKRFIKKLSEIKTQ